MINRQEGGSEPEIDNSEIADKEKQRTLSDADLLKDGAEYMTNEAGQSFLHLTESQINEVREEMDIALEIEREKSIEKEIIERPLKKTERKGPIEKVFDISYDERGNKILEASGEHDDFLGGRPIRRSFFYDENNVLSHERSRELSGGWFNSNDWMYDDRGNVLSYVWEERPYGKKADNWGRIDYEYEFDENGDIASKTGKGKSDMYEFLSVSVFQHDPSKNASIQREKTIKAFFGGPFAGQKHEEDITYFREYTEDGKLRIESKMYKGYWDKEKGKNVDDVSVFSYNEQGDLIQEERMHGVEGKEVGDRRIINHDLEYGPVEIEKSTSPEDNGKKEIFIRALDEYLTALENLGKISSTQAEEKRSAAHLIETGFSDDPEHDAQIFVDSGIVGEEEMIESVQKKRGDKKE